MLCKTHLLGQNNDVLFCQLRVRVFSDAEPAYFAESLEPMEVTAGDAVCLKCQVAGTPEIKVSWYKADGKVRSSPTCKLEYSKGVACLKLSKATKADIGEYTCKAENRIGSASSTCRLNVLGEHQFFLLSKGLYLPNISFS